MTPTTTKPLSSANVHPPPLVPKKWHPPRVIRFRSPSTSTVALRPYSQSDVGGELTSTPKQILLRLSSNQCSGAFPTNCYRNVLGPSLGLRQGGRSPLDTATSLVELCPCTGSRVYDVATSFCKRSLNEGSLNRLWLFLKFSIIPHRPVLSSPTLEV